MTGWSGGVTGADGGRWLNGVVCTGTVHFAYTPPLELWVQDVHVEEVDRLTNCVSSDPAIHSGTARFSGTVPLSCLQPIDVFSLSDYTIWWTDQLFSTMDVTFTVTTAGGISTSVMTGEVTEGAFQGGTVEFVYVYAQPNVLQCLLTGIRSQTGVLEAAIIDPA